ncbi:MAG TPA: hypothetical protein DCF68_08345 [Cyanothece sp. UBA12306]|nr:hypothetical protein [Cyanothece sp. UBA12306]
MAKIHRDRLIIFTRYPEPGKTKTRLIPALGAKGAAQLQRQLTEHTLKQIKPLINVKPLINEIDVAIYYTGTSQEIMKNWLGNNLTYCEQAKGDLGQKMQSAFSDSFALEYSRVIIIGIDCIDLNYTIVEQALKSLIENDLVLGKAADGGYYLIGLKQIFSELFQDIPWGTNQVLSISQDIAKKLGLNTCILPTLSDIDRPEDLPMLEKYGIFEL